MKRTEKNNPYQGMRRPTVVFDEAEYKEIMHYCVDNGFKIGDFLKRAAWYCVKKGIKPDKE